MVDQLPAPPIDPYGRDQFDVSLDQIPLTTDRIPYAQLGALGKYRDQTLPDTAPPVLAELFASNANFQGDLLQTDGQRNLKVFVVNEAGGGGGALALTKFFDSGITTVGGGLTSALTINTSGLTLCGYIAWGVWFGVGQTPAADSVSLSFANSGLTLARGVSQLSVSPQNDSASTTIVYASGLSLAALVTLLGSTLKLAVASASGTAMSAFVHAGFG